MFGCRSSSSSSYYYNVVSLMRWCRLFSFEFSVCAVDLSTSDDHFLLFLFILSFSQRLSTAHSHALIHKHTLLTMKETKILNRESASLEKKGEFIQFTEQIHLKYIGLLLMCFINKTFTTKWLNLSLFRMCSRQADHFVLCSIGFYERNVYIIIQLISCIDMWSLLFVQ